MNRTLSPSVPAGSSPLPAISRHTALAVGFSTLLVLGGCNALRGGGGSGGSSSIVSDSTETAFTASLPTRAYTYHDDNTADIYLTDLSDAELTSFFAPGADWSRMSGTLVHIHLFLDPKPGKTPIESTAASASVRYAIIADGQIGIYDGAGFMLPRQKPGQSKISGSLNAAPLRLSRATPAFVDPFGAAKLDLSFEAPLDDRAAPELRARMDALAARAMPVREQ